MKISELQSQKNIFNQVNIKYESFYNENIGNQGPKIITNERNIPIQYSSQLPSHVETQNITSKTPHNLIYSDKKIVSENVINSSRIYSPK